ncbi:DNA polymerase IV [Staphylococcus agnetis]|uniref:DNA polymerase IV n=1 Tax=Staphylococcus agnetis TaxID=985762 RepID=UPI00208E751D|nr:DNA polymerase IV [Staphylococcus agnetis]MCO4338642.1 DNA polymerase IV [Staphylococcus agnetis]MCO4340685.1 DNA polymerase IV [Staphylococcus agnetis]MCO4343432.1 DNA polymerase IV [Staphylococcus agnetis]MCO4346262.1 DNA polymerase IV [Staphylococcus agnetis]MCO4347711.1 DNA polymerase IV [Staphylococcus agnetis]
MVERRIIHIDMDFFFAQVEVRDQPYLRGKPVIVGGKASGRGVVATASYEARKFGVHSAMPMARAHQLCPDGYFITPRFEMYKAVSKEIMSIFKSYTEFVEPLSLDEAYLDITELVRPDFSASQIAQFIRRDIYEQTQLTASAGVSYNKFLAKLASGMNKPNGLTVITYDNVHDILMALDIGDFPGVGRASKEKMHAHGIFTGKDLYRKSERELIYLFGKRGHHLYERARGIDHRAVKSERIRKSVGAERTFSIDTNDDDQILRKVEELSLIIESRLSQLKQAGRTVTVKIKTNDFKNASKQRSLSTPLSDAETIYQIAYDLYYELKAPEIPIRLIGVTVGGLEDAFYRNMTIYDFL